MTGSCRSYEGAGVLPEKPKSPCLKTAPGSGSRRLRLFRREATVSVVCGDMNYAASNQVAARDGASYRVFLSSWRARTSREKTAEGKAARKRHVGVR